MYNWFLSVLELSDDINDYILLGSVVLVIGLVMLISKMFLSVFTSIFKKY